MAYLGNVVTAVIALAVAQNNEHALLADCSSNAVHLRGLFDERVAVVLVHESSTVAHRLRPDGPTSELVTIQLHARAAVPDKTYHG